MARVRVTRNFKFTELLDDIAPTEPLMRQAGEELAVKIENRTLAGRDENDRPFPLRTTGGPRGPSSRVAMFKDFGVTSATRRGFTLGFRSRRSERIAEYYLHAMPSRMPARAFCAVPARWVRDIIRRLRR